jgi:hypothetical protein
MSPAATAATFGLSGANRRYDGNDAKYGGQCQ